MNFLQRLVKLFFGAPSAGGTAGDVGLYYYVKSKRSGEVIRLRVNPNNDLSLMDDGGYFVRKMLHGTVGYDSIEVELTFDKGRKLADAKISGGEMVDKAAFEAWQQSQGAKA
jgi:hypothetical protein